MKTRFWKRGISSLLSAAMLLGVLQFPVAAEKSYVSLPEVEIGQDILDNNLFYIPTTAAMIGEADNTIYLLRVARGGACEEAAGVTVKVADVTAKLGKDYEVRVHNEDTEVENPRDNQSLLERMEGEEFTQSERKSEEETLADMESDPEMAAVSQQAYQTAVDYVLTESGIQAESKNEESSPAAEQTEKKVPTESEPTGQPDEMLETEPENTQVSEPDVNGAGEVVSTNPIQQAKRAYTGIDAEPQRVTATADMMQQMQDMANVLTNAVVGASVQLEFAPGEREKYIEIEPVDNSKGDGDRYFYMMLAAPYGSCTNSAASNTAVTIADDEEAEPSEVSFSQDTYRTENGVAAIEVRREGALGSMAEVKLTSEEVTAVQGRDFSKIERTLIFPMGIDHQTVEIPVESKYFDGEKQFNVKLEAGNGSVVRQDTAVVSIEGSKSSELAVMAAAAPRAAARLGDIRLGTAIDLSNPKCSGHDDNYYGGNNHWESGNKQWLMEWMDNTIWRNRKGSVGATWRLTDAVYGYEFAGAQIKWDRTGSCAGVRAAFSHGASDWKSVWNSSYPWAYDSQNDFGDETKNLFSGAEDTYMLGIYNQGHCDDCNRLWIKGITPILRPFQIIMQEASKLKFLQADGTYKADDGTATKAMLVGAPNNDNKKIVQYAGDTITVSQESGSNITNYARLSTLYTVADGNKKELAKKDNDAKTTIEYKIPTGNNLTLIDEYIKFKDNDYMKNPNGTKGKYAELTIQPEFAYKNAKVTIKAPEAGDVNAGYINISGKAYDLKGQKSLTLDDTYHLGDTLRVTTTMYDQYKDEYIPTGFKLRYKQTRADRNTKEDKYFYKDGPRDISNGRMSYEEIEIIPTFEKKENRIQIRVKKDELDRFDTGYGLFLSGNPTETVLNGITYCDYTFADTSQTVYGRRYAIPVRIKDSSYRAVWQENGDDTKYCGESFYYTAKNSPSKNIIYLSALQASDQPYFALSGRLYYMSYNLKTGAAGTENAMPAKGAAVSAPGGGAIADEDGNFKTTRFPGIPGYSIRYMVSVNGKDEIRTLSLHKNNPQSADGQTTYVNTIQQTMDSQVSPVNSEMFQNGNIRLRSSNEMGGQVIPVVTDGIAEMEIFAGVPTYTQVRYDDNGSRIETPNQKETPVKAELVVYDDKNEVVTIADAKKDEDLSSAANVVFRGGISFSADESGNPPPAIEPGDRIFLRLTTDRGREFYGGDAKDSAYVYTDVFTGYVFSTDTDYSVPVPQQLDVPIDVSFEELPFLGDTGMDFNFPFVSLGTMRLDNGYRLYIGASIGSIIDVVSGSHMTTYKGDAGDYYKDMFSIKHPIQTFKKGLAETYDAAFNGVPDMFAGATSYIGVPTWKFDVQIGVYFDFIYAKSTDPNNGATRTICEFSGVGAYVGAQVGFKKAWYTILPVVFIPAYIGLEINANALGFLGAERDLDASPISFETAKGEQVDFGDSIKKFNGSIKFGGMFQLYAGVGLAGTIGVRIQGSVNAMGVYEPSDLVDDMGGAVNFNAGILIDLFLFSVPLNYDIATLKFGSIQQYADGVHTTPSKQANLMAADAQQPSFQLRGGNEGDPVWMPDYNPLLRGAFSPMGHTTIVENGYERPDSQLIPLPDGSLILAYLDNAPANGALERTTLKVAAFKDGRWSDTPVVVQNDGTADYQPSICVADDKVMVAWVSSEPDVHQNEDAVDYLKYLDVYTAMIDPTDLSVSEITRLTTEDTPYYDYNPVCVYDDITKDRTVYYLKADTQGTVEEIANSYSNDCAVIYRLYDADTNSWLETYFDNELDPALQEQMKPWKGQRFLASPIKDGSIDLPSPNMADFTATSYNGLAVYAYTIDPDSSNDTDYDKELFAQIYDFTTHKTYHPIRITDDMVSDAMPQLVRTGEGENASTRLFWYRDGKTVQYVNLSKLIKEGINDYDGTLKDDYEFNYSAVSPRAQGSMDSTVMGDFKVVQDADDNLYVIWTQPTPDENGEYTSQEIYATALVGENDIENDDEANKAAEAAAGGSNWANPYRLTTDGFYNDEPSVAVDGQGNMMVVHNQFKQTLTGNDQKPLEISDLKLMATYMEPCGSMDVQDVQLSNPMPMAGEKVAVTVTLENNGLTKAHGFSLKAFENMSGQKKELLMTDEVTGITLPYATDDAIAPGNGAQIAFYWTVPEQVTGSFLEFEVTEGNYTNISEFRMEPLEEKPVYTISGIEAYQLADGLHVAYDITNSGNAVNDSGERFDLILTGPYGMGEAYDMQQRYLCTDSVGSIAVGETKHFDVKPSIMPEMFEKHGYITALAACYDKDGETLASNYESVSIALEQPCTLTLNGGEQINITEGKTKNLTAALEPADLYSDAEIVYSIKDSSIVSVEGDVLTGLAEGTTTVYAVVMPYGFLTEVDVTVTKERTSGGGSGGGRTEKYTIDFDTQGGSKIASQTITSGKRLEAPENPTKDGYVFAGWYTDQECTQDYDFSQTVKKSFTLYAKWAENTAEPQPWKNPFTDVKNTDWFYGDVQYAHENNLFAGISDTEFGPNNPMTRAMLVTVLYRAEGEPSLENEILGYPFADVDAESWYGDAVYWARLHGIVKGYSDEAFAPEQEISREQIAAILERYADFKGIATDEKGDLSKFSDVSEISDWAKSNVEWAVGAGLISGRDVGTIDPLGSATRAEVAAILHRYLTKNNQ